MLIRYRIKERVQTFVSKVSILVFWLLVVFSDIFTFSCNSVFFVSKISFAFFWLSIAILDSLWTLTKAFSFSTYCRQKQIDLLLKHDNYKLFSNSSSYLQSTSIKHLSEIKKVTVKSRECWRFCGTAFLIYSERITVFWYGNLYKFVRSRDNKFSDIANTTEKYKVVQCKYLFRQQL